MPVFGRQPLVFLFVFLGLSCPASLRAAPAQAHATVILVQHLSWAEISRTTLPHLAALRDTGQMALLSPGSPRPPDPLANAYASVTAGDVVNTKNPHAGLLQRTLRASVSWDRVTLTDFGDAGAPARLAALDSALGKLELSHPSERIMICSVVPPQDSRGGWDRLTVVLTKGIGPAGATLTSDTTHTPGLVALRDIAPTILSWAGVPVPKSMTGAPLRAVVVSNRASLLGRIDRLTQLNQHILLPLAWFLGWFGGLALLGTVWTLASRKRFAPGALRYLLRAVIAFPLATLVAPVFGPQTVLVYALMIVALDLALALVPSAGALCALTAGVIVVDALTGAHLVAQTALSGYWLPGIRFYGIGNEYMGVLLGTGLLAPVLVWPASSRTGAPSPIADLPPPNPLPPPGRGGIGNSARVITPPSWREGGRGVRSAALALWFLVVLIALSYPEFGAKAGGAVTAMVCFAPAWFALVLGRRIGWASFLLSALAGFAVVLAEAAIAHWLGSRETHIQAASAALGSGRLGYIWHVALRKAKMAVKIFLHPGVFLTLAGLVLTYFIWRRSSLPSEMARFLAGRADLAAALKAGAWGILACFLFNDSGTVAGFFLFGVLILAFLHEMLGPTSARQSTEDGQRQALPLHANPPGDSLSRFARHATGGAGLVVVAQAPLEGEQGG